MGRFLLMTAVVPLAGLWMRWFASVRALNRPARLMLYFAAGLVTLTEEMFLASLAGIPWSAALLLVPPLLAGLPSLRRPLAPPYGTRRVAPPPSAALPAMPRPRWEIVLAAATVVIVALTIASGAATGFDTFFFWGLKAQRFGLLRAIDVAYLRDPVNMVFHPDYPPLHPFYLAWTMLGGDHLDWWVVVATAPLFLLLSTVTVYSFIESRLASSLTALYASALGALFILNALGGNAEPPLVFFETLALAAMASGAGDAAVAVGLTGAVLAKREGLPFFVLAMAVYVINGGRDRWKRLRAGIPAAVALLAWLAYCRHHGLFKTYNLGAEVFTVQSVLRAVHLVAQDVSVGLWYLPWIAGLALIACGRIRPALPYVAATLGYCLLLVYEFSRWNDPVGLAIWSVSRVMISTWLFLFFGAVVALRRVE
jgi:hypothetical protein